MNSSDLWNFFVIAALGFSFCIVPLLVIGTALFTLNTNTTLRKTHQQLAQTLGYRALNQAKNIPSTWYGGMYQGRRVAFTTFASTYRTYGGDGGSRVGVTVKVRIVMEVDPAKTSGLTIQRSDSNKIFQSFEEAFHVGGTPSGPATRDAMLAFVSLGYPTGIKKDLSVRFTQGTRNLMLAERSQVTDHTLREEIHPDAKAFLIHEHPAAGLSTDRFKTLLAELDAVAQAIDTDQVPALLAGKTIPPREGSGRYVPWIIFGILFGVLPIFLCLCVVLYTMLAS